MTLDQIKDALCVGEFSSFSITFNDGSGANYMSVEEWLFVDQSHFYCDDDFVGGKSERQRCIETNSLWTAQWYPNTPVGFCLLHAASFETLLKGLTTAAESSE